MSKSRVKITGLSGPKNSVGADLRVCPEAACLRRPGQTRRSVQTHRSAPTMRRSIVRLLSLLVCLAAVFAVSACRQDMHDNPRFEANEDGANRQPPEGTVARGSLALAVTAPKAAVPGQVGSVGEDGFPFKLSADPGTRKKEIMEILDRGESRFNITCLPCHGKLGDGNGMVALRGFRHPPNYRDDRLRNAPTSHF